MTYVSVATAFHPFSEQRLCWAVFFVDVRSVGPDQWPCLPRHAASSLCCSAVHVYEVVGGRWEVLSSCFPFQICLTL